MTLFSVVTDNASVAENVRVVFGVRGAAVLLGRDNLCLQAARVVMSQDAEALAVIPDKAPLRGMYLSYFLVGCKWRRR